jgi:hypothetical protein
MKLKDFITKKKLAIIFVALGALTGFIYWRYIGCSGGACVITSNPIVSSLYGAIMGWFVGDFFSFPEKQKTR